MLEGDYISDLLKEKEESLRDERIEQGRSRTMAHKSMNELIKTESRVKRKQRHQEILSFLITSPI